MGHYRHGSNDRCARPIALAAGGSLGSKISYRGGRTTRRSFILVLGLAEAIEPSHLCRAFVPPIGHKNTEDCFYRVQQSFQSRVDCLGHPDLLLVVLLFGGRTGLWRLEHIPAAQRSVLVSMGAIDSSRSINAGPSAVGHRAQHLNRFAGWFGDRPIPSAIPNLTAGHSSGGLISRSHALLSSGSFPFVDRSVGGVGQRAAHAPGHSVVYLVQ